MINFLRDIRNFAQQFLPPITIFRQYRFSPADFLYICPSNRSAARKLLSSTSSSANEISHAVAGSSTDTSTVNTTSQRYNSNCDKELIISTIDILTYNINHVLSSDPDRRRNIIQAIFSSGAQIILLQETTPSWEELLHEHSVALQYNYCHFHHPREETKYRQADRPAGGVAVLSQYPLENVHVLDFAEDIAGSVFPALICEIFLNISLSNWNPSSKYGLSDDSSVAVKLRVGNVHLRPPVELDGSAWLETARKTEPIRIAEVKELIYRSRKIASASAHNTEIFSKENNKSKPPMDIIAGDFNEGDFGGAITHLASQGYLDALQKFVPQIKETHTWPFMRNFWTLRKRLDHVLWHSEPLALTAKGHTQPDFDCTARLQCLGCGVVTGYETDASDHQPVLSRFSIVKE